MPIPVEVSTFGLLHTERRLRTLGATTTIRRAADGTPGPDRRRQRDHRLPVRRHRRSRQRWIAQLQCLAGVLETGLFLDLCDTLIVGTADGRREDRDRRPGAVGPAPDRGCRDPAVSNRDADATGPALESRGSARSEPLP